MIFKILIKICKLHKQGWNSCNSGPISLKLEYNIIRALTGEEVK